MGGGGDRGMYVCTVCTVESGVDCTLYVWLLQSRHCTAVYNQLLYIHHPVYVQYRVAREVTNHVEVAVHTDPKLAATINKQPQQTQHKH